MVADARHPTGCRRLGHLIAESRIVRRVSQRRLAELVHERCRRPIARSRVAQWEGGHRAVAGEQLAAIELALNLVFHGIDRGKASPGHRLDYCAARIGVPVAADDRSTGRRLVEIDLAGEVHAAGLELRSVP